MKLLLIFIISVFFLITCKQKSSNEITGKSPFTPEMAETMKKTMKKDLAGSDIQKTNDLDKFCDCVVNKLQSEFTVKEIMEPEFSSSKKYKQSRTRCLESTKIK
ncbi:MAG: hypothetical protein WKF35_05190 [Ferruginibacter sp.]